MKIYDLQGKLVYQKVIQSAAQNSLQINTAEMLSGIYLMEINSGDDVFCKRIVKM